MKKLHLEKVEERKEFKSPKSGGYVFGAYAVEDVPDKEYIKISYDIVEGEFKGYYSNLVKEGIFKALPIIYASYKDKALPIFKGTITSFEKSNKGFKWADDETQLKGKKFGGVLAEEEYEKNDGSVGTSFKIAQVHSTDAIKNGDFKIPEVKKLTQTASTSSSPFGKSTESKKEEDFFGAEETNPFDSNTVVEEVVDVPFDEENNPFA